MAQAMADQMDEATLQQQDDGASGRAARFDANAGILAPERARTGEEHGSGKNY